MANKTKSDMMKELSKLFSTYGSDHVLGALEEALTMISTCAPSVPVERKVLDLSKIASSLQKGVTAIEGAYELDIVDGLDMCADYHLEAEA